MIGNKYVMDWVFAEICGSVCVCMYIVQFYSAIKKHFDIAIKTSVSVNHHINQNNKHDSDMCGACMCDDDTDDDDDDYDDNDDNDDDDNDNDDDRSRAIWKKTRTFKEEEWYKRVMRLSMFKVHDTLKLKCHYEANHFVY